MESSKKITEGQIEDYISNSVQEALTLKADITNVSELAQDAVGTILLDTATIDLTYTDATPSISADVKANSITATQLADNINISEFTNDAGYITDVNLSYTPSATNGVVVNDKGTDATIPTVDFTNAGLLTPEEKQLLYNNSATGTTKFTGFTINADPTKYNTSLVEGWFVDNTTNPNIPTKVFKSFPATTGNTLTNIASQNVTYIAIDINGVHHQSGVPFEPETQRDWIPLGLLVHSNRVVINAVNNQPVIAISPNAQLSDLMESIGFFNISGNIFSANGANLNINKSAGQVFKQGSNFINNTKDPHTLSLSALVAPTNIRYRTQTGTEFADTAVIDAGFYDLAGVRTAIPGTRWSIQRIYVFQTNLVRIQYGQATYTTLADAIQAITTEAFVIEQNILENGIFRGLLIVREGATDLTDPLRALFIAASKFGSVAGLGSLSTTSLQQAYNNSLTPEITTNSTLGAVTVKRGSSADTDTVLEVQNGVGAVTASIKGNGEILGSNLSGTNTGDNATNTQYSGLVASKQDTLVSGTNIKTINGTSVLGSGDIAIVGGSGDMILASAQTNTGLKTFLDSTIGFRNAADTFTSLVTNTNTAARTYTFQDKTGTLAQTDDYSIVPLNEGSGIGHVISGRIAANYGNVGLRAIDLGYSGGASSVIGATGQSSVVAGGEGNRASGNYSVVAGGINNTATGYSFIGSGNGNTTSGNYCFIGGGVGNSVSGSGVIIGGNGNTAGQSAFVGGGDNQIASGAYSGIPGGIYMFARSYGEIAAGVYGTDYTPLSASAWQATDRLFNLGNGTGTGARSNAFTILKNGTVINSNVVRLKNYTVATLPTGTQGDTAYVTDALTPTYLGVLVGGGAVVTPVFHNGTNWVSH